MSDSFPRQSARTRRFTLGAPRDFRVADDGSRVAFLRSTSGDDPVNRLVGARCRSRAPSGSPSIAAALLSAHDDDVPEAELAASRASTRGRRRHRRLRPRRRARPRRRSRCPVGSSSPISSREAPSSCRRPATRSIRACRPTGSRVAYVSGATLRCTSARWRCALIAGEDAPDVSWGSAEFVAAEEMHRTRGFWWAPDGDRLLVERVDVSPCRVWHIASPVDPWIAPPRGALSRGGHRQRGCRARDRGPRRVAGRRSTGSAASSSTCATPAGRHATSITLVVQSARSAHRRGAGGRSRRRARCARSSGSTTTRWVELVPGAPAWVDDRLITAEDRGRRSAPVRRPRAGDARPTSRCVACRARPRRLSTSPPHATPTEVHVWRLPLSGGRRRAADDRTRVCTRPRSAATSSCFVDPPLTSDRAPGRGARRGGSASRRDPLASPRRRS